MSPHVCRPVGVFCLLFVATVAPAVAQGPTTVSPTAAPFFAAPRVEIAGAYSFLPEVPQYDVALNRAGQGHGAALALDLNLGRHVGLRADVDLGSWTFHESTSTLVQTPQAVTLYYSSFGARFIKRWNRITLYGLALLEARRNDFGGTTMRVYQPKSDSWREYVDPGHRSGAGGFGLGGGLDVRVREHLAVRVVEVNQFCGLFGEGPSRRDLRIKTGVVVSFGQMAPRRVR